MSSNLPVAVVGAGAVGCYFGGMLARAGVSVTLIGRAPHVEAIRRDGLRIVRADLDERVSVAATTSMEDGLRGARAILFCVKTVRTESAALEMAPWLAPEAVILSFQNGVDNPARIQSAIGREALPVVVYVAAEMTAPGCVTHSGRGDLVVGRDAAGFAPLFERARVPCAVVDSIAVELWTKMMMNCAYNGLSALTRAQYGRMVQSAPVRALMQQAVAEAVAVAQAEGVPLSEPAILQAVNRLGEKMSGATSSTAQDIARGRSTEIDSLNGYIARRGEALGIATPINRALVALVKLLEESALNSRSD